MDQVSKYDYIIVRTKSQLGCLTCCTYQYYCRQWPPGNEWSGKWREEKTIMNSVVTCWNYVSGGW